MTKRIVVLGLGRIGGAIGKILSQHKNYQIVGADINLQTIQYYAQFFPTKLIENNDFDSILANQDAVISALSFKHNPEVAQAALKSGCSYFDLTEDIRSTKAIKQIALQAAQGQVFMPQCGLAPGFIGILAHGFVKVFDKLDTLKLRVGALPEVTSNQMMFNLTWSTEGLINQYARPCEAIKNHQITLLEPLEGHEVLRISGIEYEAFNTSGGLANLCYALDGQIRELTYKTIRYPGHCQLMKFLFHDLRLGEEGNNRNMLKDILEGAIATTAQDLVLISVIATGYIGDKLQQRTRTFFLRHTDQQSAIQIATASAAVTTLDLIIHDKKPRSGFVEQEAIDIDAFLNNEFAKPYFDAELTI
jgi:saccharopine dehydrogenase-like NADP-dependent oxidoreductase